ncbi:hypothetical protein A9G30_09805 [Gilliamella sp. Fer4-1]|nr:hypothetical protein A9G30_09805 [Gilliamella apicola]
MKLLSPFFIDIIAVVFIRFRARINITNSVLTIHVYDKLTHYKIIKLNNYMKTISLIEEVSWAWAKTY